MTAQEVLDSGLVVLLTFLPLTKGGKEPDNIEQMIERLVAANEIDLLAVSYPLGGLVFDKEPEREWFKRRFKMLQDVLKDSWVYQELIEEGLEKGRQQELEHQKQILLDIVASSTSRSTSARIATIASDVAGYRDQSFPQDHAPGKKQNRCD